MALNCAEYGQLLAAEMDGLGRVRHDIAVRTSAEAMEAILLSVERDLEIGLAERQAIKRRQVVAALYRVRNGSYGVCTQCEEPIDERRLNALPWASLCRACAELAERPCDADAGCDSSISLER